MMRGIHYVSILYDQEGRGEDAQRDEDRYQVPRCASTA